MATGGAGGENREKLLPAAPDRAGKADTPEGPNREGPDEAAPADAAAEAAPNALLAPKPDVTEKPDEVPKVDVVPKAAGAAEAGEDAAADAAGLAKLKPPKAGAVDAPDAPKGAALAAAAPSEAPALAVPWAEAEDAAGVDRPPNREEPVPNMEGTPVEMVGPVVIAPNSEGVEAAEEPALVALPKAPAPEPKAPAPEPKREGTPVEALLPALAAPKLLKPKLAAVEKAGMLLELLPKAPGVADAAPKPKPGEAGGLVWGCLWATGDSGVESCLL